MSTLEQLLTNNSVATITADLVIYMLSTPEWDNYPAKWVNQLKYQV